jgi:hypothetical protein
LSKIAEKCDHNIDPQEPYAAKFVTEEKITEIAFVGMVGGILGLFLGSRCQCYL